MKTKVKLASILAALLLGACADPLSAPVGESAASAESGEHTVIFPADPNKGLVLLSVNGAPSAARVVLPELNGATYSYRWYAEAEDAAAVAEPQCSGDFTPDADSPLAIALEPARWTLTVRAWTGTAPAEDAEDPPAPAFAGRTELALSAGAAQSLTVGLLPNGEGSGTFSYDVSLSDVTPGYAFISVFPLDGGDAVDVIDLEYRGLNGTLALPSGYYNITTAVNYKDGATQKFATKREVLYIYDDLTSPYAVTFETDDFTALLPALTTSNQGTDAQNSYLYAVRTFNTTTATSIWSTTNLNNLSLFLARTPQNTPDTPYFIALTGFKLDGTDITASRRLGTTIDPLEDMFAVTQGRYVFYDLSGCTGDMADIASQFTIKARRYPDRVTGVILPDSVTKIGAFAFDEASSLMHIRLGSNVTSIGNGAFRNCTSLRFIALPETVTSLGTQAFSYSGLLAVDLHSDISNINALNYCNSLKSLTIRTNTTIGATVAAAGEYLKGLDVVYVPGSKLQDYRSSPTWNTVMTAFAQRTGLDGTALFQEIP
jgi:hypothetical protein